MFCSRCGQENPAGGNFCMKCGQSLQQVAHLSTAKQKQSPWKMVAKTVGLSVFFFVVTFIALNLWGVVDSFSPLLGTKTNEAEYLALELVQEHYPELVNAERSSYLGRIDRVDYYVVDFVLREAGKPPVGARVLVDRLLRAVFVYEVIGSDSALLSQGEK